jgi:hypothetical protein
MKAPLWARKDFWKQIDELEAELAQVVEKTEKVAKEARLALAGLPALRDDFDAYLAWRLPVWQSYLRQLVIDLFADLEAEAEARAKVGSSSALEDQEKTSVPLLPSRMEVRRNDAL